MSDNPAASKGTAMIPLDRAPFTFKTLQAVAATDFVPAPLRNKPNSILAAILIGRELGLGPMESLRSIDVIDGRPSPSAEWMVGRVFEAGHVIEVVEQTDKVCTVKGTRYHEGEKRGEMSFTFTMDMAKRANLTGKFNWKAYPEAMLYWRAVAQLIRQFFPDVIRGVKHTADELGRDELPHMEFIEPEYPEPQDERIVDQETGELLESSEPEAEPAGHDEAEEAIVWPPEPTGKADELAIDAVTVASQDVDDNVWGTLLELIGDHERWLNDTMEEIEGRVRFICRAMEFLDIWQSPNILREFLSKTKFNHISEMKKADLQQFARNVVMRAQLATREEGSNAD